MVRQKGDRINPNSNFKEVTVQSCIIIHSYIQGSCQKNLQILHQHKI
jgi:hypothetical protein